MFTSVIKSLPKLQVQALFCSKVDYQKRFEILDSLDQTDLENKMMRNKVFGQKENRLDL
jgi:hypothetical protein